MNESIKNKEYNETSAMVMCIGTINMKYDKPQDAFAKIIALIDSVKASYPKTKLIFITIPKLNVEGIKSSVEQVNVDVDEFNTLLQSLQDNDIDIINFGFQDNMLNKDGIHLKPNASTTDALLHVTNRLFSNASNNKISVGISFDLSKAFDRVPHFVLLNKLKSVGLEGKLLGWFQSYLTDRSQRVKIDNVLSSLSYTYSSVPQGSTLGPLLFIIFINDLSDVISSSVLHSLFDDDLFLVCNFSKQDSLQNLQSSVQAEID
ncbi:unnamed protein product [Rotaria sp. Silwood2]|nr:unnamed protein product [Rotaria sp. Silwood2]